MENRREALKKLGALGVGALAGQSLLATMPERHFPNTDKGSNGVVVGKSNKKEILYHKTPAWEIFYKSVW
ncbi:hypothetical protein HBZC1_13520 [Helicobacter bizzozeronii CIII-1]|uniref:Tat pathway signal protein n=2 Tax=Helicobacter TaxID=209 RepID=A0A553UUM6_9HELI|nr:MULTISPECIES: hypothetical protein [Helicobacter]TSA83916.1 hypothetical protein FNE76_04500 [Helicobacter mehlei]CCB80338.1 hypothetical protein HBZC1_13520 [Helicobacter bizzozeronii CIII-1]